MVYLDTDKIISVEEAAKVIGISERRVRQLLRENRLQGKKIGRGWLVFESSYERSTRGPDKQPRKRRTKGGNQDAKS